MDTFCPSCHSSNHILIGKIPLMDTFAGNKLPDPFPQSSLIKCKDCNLYFKWPKPIRKELSRLYQNGNPENWQYELIDRKDWQIAKDWINRRVSEGIILDVGCWDGKFLENFSSSYELYGIEINSRAAEKAGSKGIKIVSSDISDMSALPVEADVTTAFDIIEHFEDPFKLISSMAKATRKNGNIIISSGNTEALTWKLGRNKYWYSAISEHIVFINKRWCNYAAERLNLQIKYEERYSRFNKNSMTQTIKDVVKDISYLMGYRHIEKSAGKDFYHPTYWMTSKDHLIIIFEKR